MCGIVGYVGPRQALDVLLEKCPAHAVEKQMHVAAVEVGQIEFIEEPEHQLLPLGVSNVSTILQFHFENVEALLLVVC